MTPLNRGGLLFALCAYVLWGAFPIYFKSVADVPPLEVLSHRILGSLVMTVIGVAVLRDWAPFFALLRSRKRLLQLVATVVMLSANWLIYIWAVGAGHVIDSGLGYYICPLMSVLLAAVILRERIGIGQIVGILCVAAGVLWQIIAVGQVPWVALSLATTFSLYGLGRKVLALPAMAGLFAETLVMTPFAIGYLAWRETAGIGHFIDGDAHHRLLLLLAGPVTAIPLLFFAAAANRLNLQVLGLMQYFNPTMQVCLAIFLFGEQMLPGQAVTFTLIWLGLVLYSVLPLLGRRQVLAAQDRQA
jgi:chloramphenicol-sensitive protein RarD